MTPLAPVNSTMPNSLSVSSRTRLPPAISAGHASGMITDRSTRNGDAPRLAATSSCARGSIENEASSGRITNGVKKVISAAITPGRRVEEVQHGRSAPVSPAISRVHRARGAVEEGERQRDQERRQREHGVDQPADQLRAGERHEREHDAPGTCRGSGSPASRSTAMATVRHSAARNTSEASTHSTSPRRRPRRSTSATPGRPASAGRPRRRARSTNGGTTHHAANDLGGRCLRCRRESAGRAVAVTTRPGPARRQARGSARPTSLSDLELVRPRCPGTSTSIS